METEAQKAAEPAGVMYSGYVSTDMAAVIPAPRPMVVASEPPAPRKLRQVPSAGRIVLYVSADGLNRWPAVITKVNRHSPSNTTVDLAVMAGNATAYVHGINYREDGGITKTWHWPPYVPPVEDPTP